MDFQNTLFGGNDFSAFTAKQLSFFDNQILAWELLNSLISRDFRCIAVSSPLVISTGLFYRSISSYRHQIIIKLDVSHSQGLKG